MQLVWVFYILFSDNKIVIYATGTSAWATAENSDIDTVSLNIDFLNCCEDSVSLNIDFLNCYEDLVSLNIYFLNY